MPVSSRTSRAAVSSGLSPATGPPLGSPSTRWRPRGTITITSSPRTTTPPYDVSRSVDIALERRRVVHRQPPPPLRDHARPLEHGEEAAGRLARRAGELGQVGLRRGDLHVAGAGTLGLRLLDELPEHCCDAALHRLERLPGEALVGV